MFLDLMKEILQTGIEGIRIYPQHPQRNYTPLLQQINPL
jgi:hypothetical protein